MKQYIIRQYIKEDFALWNNFIEQSKNATFLFHRDFMEYHQDRFEDFSLMVFDNQKLVAVLPANKNGTTVFSHQGLTYGGLVLHPKTKLNDGIAMVKSILFFLNQNEIQKLNIKTIPNFYCNFFSEELEYCLFIAKAHLYRKECLSVLDLTKEISFSKDRKQCVRRGVAANLIIKEESNFELFWNRILIPNLNQKHDSKPVHSLEEISQLHQSFPNNIRHFNVYHNGEIVAGTTIFVTPNVAHPQYISGNNLKNELGSLDYLYSHLILEVFKDKKVFDFGPSHEDNGTKIKEGILFWKESFGAKTTTQNFYEVQTSNYSLLDSVLI